MSRNNQNSKWKAHQQPNPTTVEVPVKKVVEISEPLKVVEVPVEPVVEKPVVKKLTKKETTEE
jgi:hypothetical protein